LTSKLRNTEVDLEKASDANVDLKKKAKSDKSAADQRVKKLEEKTNEQDKLVR
jgi:hypothetical protein